MFVAPPSWPKIAWFFFFYLSSLKHSDIHVEQKTQLKVREKDKDKENGFERQSKTENQKWERIDENNFII